MQNIVDKIKVLKCKDVNIFLKFQCFFFISNINGI